MSAMDSIMFYFWNLAETPSLTVPEDLTEDLPGGQDTVNVTWTDISASNVDGNPVLCEVGGNNVSLTGHVFGEGTHTVNCTAQNNAGCEIMKAFQVHVAGQ